MAVTSNFTTDLLALVDDIVSGDKVEFSEAIFSKAFEHEGIAESHTVLTDVRHGGTVPIMKQTPNPDSFPFVDDTSCDTTECDVNLEFSGKKWDLGLIECRVPICLRTFDENFLRFFNTYKHACQGEPDMDSALLTYVQEVFTKNLILSTWRAAYFGDTASASVYYNGFDGFFTQLEAGDGIKIDITENAEANYADQISQLTGEDVYNYLVRMYEEAATTPWFDPSVLEFRVTRTMGSKLITFLNAQGEKGVGCECYDPNAITQSKTFNLTNILFRGIPVRVEGAWDDIINYSSELNGGGGAAARVDPHRAILTYRENLLIGTNQLDCLESFDMWYSKDTKNVYVEGSSYLGAVVPLDEYVLATGITTT